ncbi:MAG TPA: sigma-70 family RNA polymerase sigma factor [Planctomycetota bacterium]|nr:sigma-70 family RNA polymerase sigma factor [Planctomycetota bacterium]
MTELEALAAYHERRDADAFRQLVLAYQRMVYCTCRRVLGSDADAEDAAQETFLKLARAAGRIRRNPAAWLHACAVTTARDRLRSNRSRQSREAEWADMHTIESKHDWHELLPVVDDCIAGLPEDDRELLLAFYFAGRTQVDLAAARGISQPAVKKRLDRIVEDLRSRLHKLGYAVPLGLLILFLSERASDAAVPAALGASLLKIGLAGIGEGAAVAPAPVASAATGIVGGLGAKIVAAAVAAGIIVAAGVVAHRHFTKANPQPPHGAQSLPDAPIVAASHDRVAFPVLKSKVRGAAQEAKANQALANAEAIVVSLNTDELAAPYRIHHMKDGRITDLWGELWPNELKAKYAAWTNLDTNVRHEGDKVWIDGVPSLGWDKHQCTYAGALEAAMAVTERPVSYTHLMGVTGLAFRTRWFQGRIGQKWCPSSPVGEFPDEIAATQKATGWPMQVICVPDDPKMERFAIQIVASIDAGRPVPAYEPGLNMDTIYGYRDGGNTMLLKDYFKGDIEMPVEKLGWMLLILQDPVQPLSKRDAFLQGLRIAVRNWRREPAPSEKGEYLFGDAALARWAEDLGTIDTLNAADKENLMFVSKWCFASMWDARAEAARFLEQNANELGDNAKTAIERAAEIYRQEANLLRNVVQGNQSDDRKREFLAEARTIEAAAIAEIEKALNSAQ